MSARPEDLRIGDAERDAAVAALGEHFALGRLGREEYDERSEQVWSARTARDLRPLFADLPVPHGDEQVRAGTARGGTVRGEAVRSSGRRQPWRAVPLLPLVVLLAVLIVLLPGPPWPLFILGWLWVAGAFRHRRRWHGSTHW